MLTEPDINEADILNCLLFSYHLQITHLTFLPIGADLATAVYRAEAKDNSIYFVKLRLDHFQENAIRLLDYFHENRIHHIIAPIRTITGDAWVKEENFVLTVFPFVSGMNAVEKPLTETQFQELGKTLKQIHNLKLPTNFYATMKKESFSLCFSEQLEGFLNHLNQKRTNPLAIELADFLTKKESKLRKILNRIQLLRSQISDNPIENVICHADLHGYNLLITEDGQFYINDWDEAILAPKERDLMFIGSGIGGDASGTPEQQVAFYTGYQIDEVNMKILAYYRYARIIEDIAIYCNEIFSTRMNETDLEQSFYFLRSNFNPGGTITKANEAYAKIQY